MAYERLVDFVQNRMRMSHVYQPVMLLALLRGGGSSSTADIARSILAHDESQVEYYEDVTKNMVGRVLRRHGIVEKHDGGGYSLVGHGELDGEQVGRLIGLCEAKLADYMARRAGGAPRTRAPQVQQVPSLKQKPEQHAQQLLPAARTSPHGVKEGRQQSPDWHTSLPSQALEQAPQWCPSRPDVHAAPAAVGQGLLAGAPAQARPGQAGRLRLRRRTATGRMSYSGS